MAQLIIGHTTDKTARIWVRGDKSHSCVVKVAVELSPTLSATQEIVLPSKTDYTGITDFKGLQPDTEYTVRATFSHALGRPVFGRFKTMKGPAGDQSFSFVLSSCNLSVVSINNLLSYLLAAGGTAAANSSLDLPPERWKHLWFVWLRRLMREPIRFALKMVAGVIRALTDLKQPPPPYLRSPFLKLAAVFDSRVVDVVAPKKSLPAVGDVVSSEVAEGVLSCSATEIKKADKDNVFPTWRLVLGQVQGTFAKSDMLFKRAAGSKPEDHKSVGVILEVWPGKPWYDEPSFFMHAGDQIYYDFPDETRPPDTDEYRQAYREAWLDDDSNRYLLAHWPHYMTLDDHEIADQFARDFKPPAKGVTEEDYFEKAIVAYREYQHSRNPDEDLDVTGVRHDPDSYWYAFAKGRAQFFVLDTRTRRRDNNDSDGQIIDPRQMGELLAWMTRFRNELKFVVTSVPFVAQINENPRHPSPNWFAENQSTKRSDGGSKPLNFTNDKWSAPRFTRQRDAIIECIARNNIEHLVFLTGDMHCCYHATMQIGTGSKYECTTVHELAGGPVNQLQLSNPSEFLMRHSGKTCQEPEIEYEIVLDRFHSEVNAVMHLTVRYVKPVVGGEGSVPEIDWSVIRTLTDSGASGWEIQKPKPEPKLEPKTAPEPKLCKAEKSVRTSEDEPVRSGEPTMAGRISFIRKRDPAKLLPWPMTTV